MEATLSEEICMPSPTDANDPALITIDEIHCEEEGGSFTECEPVDKANKENESFKSSPQQLLDFKYGVQDDIKPIKPVGPCDDVIHKESAGKESTCLGQPTGANTIKIATHDDKASKPPSDELKLDPETMLHTSSEQTPYVQRKSPLYQSAGSSETDQVKRVGSTCTNTPTNTNTPISTIITASVCTSTSTTNIGNAMNKLTVSKPSANTETVSHPSKAEFSVVTVSSTDINVDKVKVDDVEVVFTQADSGNTQILNIEQSQEGTNPIEVKPSDEPLATKERNCRENLKEAEAGEVVVVSDEKEEGEITDEEEPTSTSQSVISNVRPAKLRKPASPIRSGAISSSRRSSDSRVKRKRRSRSPRKRSPEKRSLAPSHRRPTSVTNSSDSFRDMLHKHRAVQRINHVEEEKMKVIQKYQQSRKVLSSATVVSQVTSTTVIPSTSTTTQFTTTTTTNTTTTVPANKDDSHLELLRLAALRSVTKNTKAKLYSGDISPIKAPTPKRVRSSPAVNSTSVSPASNRPISTTTKLSTTTTTTKPSIATTTTKSSTTTTTTKSSTATTTTIPSTTPTTSAILDSSTLTADDIVSVVTDIPINSKPTETPSAKLKRKQKWEVLSQKILNVESKGGEGHLQVVGGGSTVGNTTESSIDPVATQGVDAGPADDAIGHSGGQGGGSPMDIVGDSPSPSRIDNSDDDIIMIEHLAGPPLVHTGMSKNKTDNEPPPAYPGGQLSVGHAAVYRMSQISQGQQVPMALVPPILTTQVVNKPPPPPPPPPIPSPPIPEVIVIPSDTSVLEEETIPPPPPLRMDNLPEPPQQNSQRMRKIQNSLTKIHNLGDPSSETVVEGIQTSKVLVSRMTSQQLEKEIGNTNKVLTNLQAAVKTQKRGKGKTKKRSQIRLYQEYRTKLLSIKSHREKAAQLMNFTATTVSLSDGTRSKTKKKANKQRSNFATASKASTHLATSVAGDSIASVPPVTTITVEPPVPGESNQVPTTVFASDVRTALTPGGAMIPPKTGRATGISGVLTLSDPQERFNQFMSKIGSEHIKYAPSVAYAEQRNVQHPFYMQNAGTLVASHPFHAQTQSGTILPHVASVPYTTSAVTPSVAVTSPSGSVPGLTRVQKVDSPRRVVRVSPTPITEDLDAETLRKHALKSMNTNTGAKISSPKQQETEELDAEALRKQALKSLPKSTNKKGSSAQTSPKPAVKPDSDLYPKLSPSHRKQLVKRPMGGQDLKISLNTKVIRSPQIDPVVINLREESSDEEMEVPTASATAGTAAKVSSVISDGVDSMLKKLRQLSSVGATNTTPAITAPPVTGPQAEPKMLSPTSESINLLSEEKRQEYLRMKEEYQRKTKLMQQKRKGDQSNTRSISPANKNVPVVDSLKSSPIKFTTVSSHSTQSNSATATAKQSLESNTQTLSSSETQLPKQVANTQLKGTQIEFGGGATTKTGIQGNPPLLTHVQPTRAAPAKKLKTKSDVRPSGSSSSISELSKMKTEIKNAEEEVVRRQLKIRHYRSLIEKESTAVRELRRKVQFLKQLSMKMEPSQKESGRSSPNTTVSSAPLIKQSSIKSVAPAQESQPTTTCAQLSNAVVDSAVLPPIKSLPQDTKPVSKTDMVDDLSVGIVKEEVLSKPVADPASSSGKLQGDSKLSVKLAAADLAYDPTVSNPGVDKATYNPTPLSTKLTTSGPPMLTDKNTYVPTEFGDSKGSTVQYEPTPISKPVAKPLSSSSGVTGEKGRGVLTAPTDAENVQRLKALERAMNIKLRAKYNKKRKLKEDAQSGDVIPLPKLTENEVADKVPPGGGKRRKSLLEPPPARKSTGESEAKGDKSNKTSKKHPINWTLRKALMDECSDAIPDLVRRYYTKERSLDNGLIVDKPTHRYTERVLSVRHSGETTMESFHKFSPVYSSVLKAFSSYRLNPYLQLREKITLLSTTYNHNLDPRAYLCKYDLHGTCNDPQCAHQHQRDYFLDLPAAVQKLRSLTGATFTESVPQFILRCRSSRSQLMTDEQIMVVAAAEVLASLDAQLPFTIQFQAPEVPVSQTDRLADMAEETEGQCQQVSLTRSAPAPSTSARSIEADDDVLFGADVRYYMDNYCTMEEIERTLLEQPQNVKLWIKLAYKKLYEEGRSSTALSEALHILSLALESNSTDLDLWLVYLKLYGKQPESERQDYTEICEKALEKQQNYQIFLLYIRTLSSALMKMKACTFVPQFLMMDDRMSAEERSFIVLETLLYSTHLAIISGYPESAPIGVCTDRSSEEYGILTVEDRLLATYYLAYVTAFNSLPVGLLSNGRYLASRQALPGDWESVRANGPVVQKVTAILQNSVVQLDQQFIDSPCHWAIRGTLLSLLKLEEASSAVSSWFSLPGFSQSPHFYLLYLQHQRQSLSSHFWQLSLLCADSLPFSAQVHYYLSVWNISDCQSIKSVNTFTIRLIHSLFNLPVLEYSVAMAQADTLYRVLLDFNIPDDTTLPPAADQGRISMYKDNLLYIWLCYGFYLSTSKAPSDVIIDMYETALSRLVDKEHVQLMCWRYELVRAPEDTCSSGHTMKEYLEVVTRCVTSTPCRFTTLHQRRYLDYSFHNKVIIYVGGLLHPCDVTEWYELWMDKYPDNTQLIPRVCELYMERQNRDYASIKHLCSVLSHRNLADESLWVLYVTVMVKLKRFQEALALGRRAVKLLPHSLALWKKYLTIMMSISVPGDYLKAAIAECKDTDVNVQSFLDSLPTHTHAIIK